MTVYALDDLRPSLSPDLGWIAPNAVVVGSVSVEADTSIWFGAVLRGDNEPIRLGRASNVQENSVLHTDPGFPLTVGEGCTIGHRAILHGCTIGNNSLIGMGAIILNGATIGENCLVGAGSLVTEGKQIPPGSLVIGSPGRVARELTTEEIEGLRRSAQSYVRNARRFAKGLLPPLIDDDFEPA
jgi:carbonic anhydrase/acetyltransferase-like protein (isoleucine patch superfamily)